MLKLSLLGVLALSLFVPVQDDAAKKTDDPLKDVKCLVLTKNNVKKETAVAYREAEVYFCCPKCKAGFEKETAKYAVGANQQLVQTKQFVQTKCPISGQDVDEAQKVKVGGTEVHFCCDKCVAKVNGAKDDTEKAKLVFADEPFEKGFAKAEPKKDKDSKEATPEKAKKSGE